MDNSASTSASCWFCLVRLVAVCTITKCLSFFPSGDWIIYRCPQALTKQATVRWPVWCADAAVVRMITCMAMARARSEQVASLRYRFAFLCALPCFVYFVEVAGWLFFSF